MNNSCFYCRKDQRLLDLMVPICKLEWSYVYFLRDQRYFGRCVVAFKQHKTELYQMSDEERIGFFSDLSKVAVALNEIYSPDKLNYAVYGDLVSHFHVHIVPKYKDGPEWGGPFIDGVEKHFITDDEMSKEINKINNKLKKGRYKNESWT